MTPWHAYCFFLLRQDCPPNLIFSNCRFCMVGFPKPPKPPSPPPPPPPPLFSKGGVNLRARSRHFPQVQEGKKGKFSRIFSSREIWLYCTEEKRGGRSRVKDDLVQSKLREPTLVCLLSFSKEFSLLPISRGKFGYYCNTLKLITVPGFFLLGPKVRVA